MDRRILIAAGVFVLVLCGCERPQQPQAGFLSDYSRMEQGDLMTFKNQPGERLKDYSKFIIEPVDIYFYSDLRKAKGDSRLSDFEITCLRDYMHNSIAASLGGRYDIVTKPGPNVGRIRVALTDMKEARVVRKLIPAARISGSGKSTVAMEAEVVDSRTGEQLGGYIETHVGRYRNERTRYIFGMTRPSDVKVAINKWSRELRKSIDRANGIVDPCYK